MCLASERWTSSATAPGKACFTASISAAAPTSLLSADRMWPVRIRRTARLPSGRTEHLVRPNDDFFVAEFEAKGDGASATAPARLARKKRSIVSARSRNSAR